MKYRLGGQHQAKEFTSQIRPKISFWNMEGIYFSKLQKICFARGEMTLWGSQVLAGVGPDPPAALMGGVRGGGGTPPPASSYRTLPPTPLRGGQSWAGSAPLGSPTVNRTSNDSSFVRLARGSHARVSTGVLECPPKPDQGAHFFPLLLLTQRQEIVWAAHQ